MPKSYFISSFISGLRDDLRSVVKMLGPESVRQAAEKARLQEVTWEAVFKKLEVTVEVEGQKLTQMGSLD